jgi:cyclohexa-1,5-dienecarbonyl-CoA hydratase
MDDPVRTIRRQDGAVLRLLLDAPPGNILDIRMMAALRRGVAEAAADPRTKALLFEGAGEHFSYGASIEEHRPDRIRGLLAEFHGLFRDLVRLDRVLVAVVRGRCLGGGMELACFCQRVVAAPDAVFGQPEIGLAVFPPVASVLLPWRAGQAVADEACLTGRTYAADEALKARLADQVAADPAAAADEWLAERILPQSAAALRHAVRAARLRFHREFLRDLEETERIYLDGVMRTEDAIEGIEAFLQKRRAVWKDR